MKTIKISEATTTQLDWMVAKAKSLHVRFWESPTIVEILHPNLDWISFKPSTNWSQGGPIIEREALLVGPSIGHRPIGSQWTAIKMGVLKSETCRSTGLTMLTAAMRCYVVSKLGETAEVPEELP
jgi:hypothetical protein